MTYSKPSTSTVSALFLPSRPQDSAGVERQSVDVSQNGRFFDFSSPQQAGINAGRQDAEIASFLNKAVEVGAPIYKDYLKGQGQAQATKFLGEVDVATLYRNGDTDQRNMLNSLNPFAQNMVADAYSKQSARSYIDRVAAQSAINGILRDPASTPEQVAEARAGIRSQARAASGIDRAPVASLSPYLGSIAEAEASTGADGYKQRLAAGRANNDAAIEKGIGTDLLTLDGYRTSVRDSPSDTKALGAYSQAADTWSQGIKTWHDQVTAGGSYTSKEAAELVWRGAAGKIDELLGQDNIGGAVSLLNTLDLASKKGDFQVGGAQKLSFWDQKIGNGNQSVRGAINAMAAQLQPKYDQWMQKQQLKQFGPDFAAMAQGDEGARARIEAMLPQIAKDPEVLQQVVSMTGQMQSYSRTPTNAQLNQQAQLEIGLNNPNRDQKSFNQQVLSSNLTAEQKISLLNRNTQPQDPTLSLVGQAADYGKDELGQSAMMITQARLGTGQITQQQAEEALKQDYQNLQVAVAKGTEKRIKGLIAAGETVTPIRAAEIYRNELEAIRNTRLKEAKVNPTEGMDWNSKVMGEAQYVGDQLKKTNGVGTIAVFPPSVIAGAKAAGVPLDYRNVQKYFLNRIATAKDEKGKPMFADPQKAYRQMVEDAKKGGSQPSAPQRPGQPNPNSTYSQLTLTEKMLGKEGARVMDWVQQQLGGGQAPKPAQQQAAPKANGPQSSARPVQQSPQMMVLPVLQAGLGQLANVVTGAAPASAAQGSGGASAKATLINEYSTEQMMKLWNGRERVTASTPPLPQVAANVAAGPVPMAISNVMHPFFVAIGIAEGTRTPSGGFTRAYHGHRDPGSGKWNTGTVSGQNAPNAQVVDRQWMGKLTGLQMRVAPMLRSLGVLPGTAGYNRLMFNILDSFVQSPLATTGAGGLLSRLGQVVRGGITIEAIAKARADSYFNPATGRLNAGGFDNSYSRLLADQRSRAGAFDYKRRL